jgi:hypothetical protein
MARLPREVDLEALEEGGYSKHRERVKGSVGTI